MSDDRPVIDAPTAEELSGQVPAVQAPPTREQFRSRRQARRGRRTRRRGLLLVAAGTVVVLIGVISLWLR